MATDANMTPEQANSMPFEYGVSQSEKLVCALMGHQGHEGAGKQNHNGEDLQAPHPHQRYQRQLYRSRQMRCGDAHAQPDTAEGHDAKNME